MQRSQSLTFHGDGRAPTERHPDAPATPEPYVVNPALAQVVNLAIYLGRPLLLEGEAGCGKTRLARAVAYELGLPLYPWYIRSTTRAQDGLYTYDAILRLHDVQVRQVEGADEQTSRDPRRATDYRRLGPIGQAFTTTGRPAVVLIDEIDKADVDFPNDLLTVLDDPWAFDIPETREHIAAGQNRPIVIITSNKEKGNLPAPFLRRCLYHFIEFPSTEEELVRIIDAHYRTSAQRPSGELAHTAITRFLALRSEASLFKRPGVSEFLDWLYAITGLLPREQATQALAPAAELPFPGVLLKLRADWQRHMGRQ